MSNNQVRVMAGGGRTFGLTSAILLYSDQRTVNGGDPHYYATLHRIERNRKGGAHLAAGEPATVAGCSAFVRAITDRSAFNGWLTPHMLYTGHSVTAWWCPPANRRVWFNTTGDAADDQTAVDIGERSAITPHPGLVFALAHGEWYVWAVTGADRPLPTTPLYIAPYFNIWDDGRICQGNVSRPEKVTPETIAAFEHAFFDSRFTHPNSPRLVNFKGGAGAFWKAMLARRWKKFPERHLIKTKRTLADLLRTLEKES